jgi:hypothetical protein
MVRSWLNVRARVAVVGDRETAVRNAGQVLHDGRVGRVDLSAERTGSATCTAGWRTPLERE